MDEITTNPLSGSNCTGKTEPKQLTDFQSTEQMKKELARKCKYYVYSEGMLMGFDELPEDAFDEKDDRVLLAINWSDCAVLQPGYGKRLDELVNTYRDIVESPNRLDGERMRVEVSIGWLRSLNVVAGLLQGKFRVRNPEVSQFFAKY